MKKSLGQPHGVLNHHFHVASEVVARTFGEAESRWKFPTGPHGECSMPPPQAPDDRTLVAEHEDNFSTLQLCA